MQSKTGIVTEILKCYIAIETVVNGFQKLTGNNLSLAIALKTNE